MGKRDRQVRWYATISAAATTLLTAAVSPTPFASLDIASGLLIGGSIGHWVAATHLYPEGPDGRPAAPEPACRHRDRTPVEVDYGHSVEVVSWLCVECLEEVPAPEERELLEGVARDAKPVYSGLTSPGERPGEPEEKP